MLFWSQEATLAAGKSKIVEPRDVILPFSRGRAPQGSEETTSGLDESALDNVLFRQLFENSPEAIVLLDNHDRVVDANRAFEDIFQYSLEEAQGETINSLIVPDDATSHAIRLSSRALSGKVVATETERRRKDGSTLFVRILGYPIIREDELIGIFGIYSDITLRKRFERRLKLQGAAMDSAASAIFITNREGQIEWVNRAFTELSGHSEAETFGMKPTMLDPKDSQPGLDPSCWEDLTARGIWRGHVINRHRKGYDYTVEQTITPLFDRRSGIDHFVVVQEDISDRIEAEERLHYMARHDYLTELPNRYTFNEQLNLELDRVSRTGQLLAVFVLDLDHFKDINDTYGHPVGDDLLIAVGKRLQRLLREPNPLARLGGDEFGIVQTNLKDLENARGLAQRILQAFQDPFSLRGRQVHVCLIKKADMAMYEAKAAGRAAFRFYEDEMDREVQLRMRLGQDLHGAVGNGELYLEFQPQVETPSRTIVSLEALLRWQHPERGLISPDRFISVAEGSGLIIPIGKWVMRTACAQAKIWEERFGVRLPVAVNLSSIQFRDALFVDSVEEILEQTGLAPDLLELELTESILMQASADVEGTLRRLCAMGVQLSLDDFGKGYSSLEYLRRIPLHKLKIDQSFVQGLGNGSHEPVIVSVIVALGKKLGLEVVAEGVETSAQLAFLTREGCTCIQGYYFSEPVPSTDLDQLLKRGNREIAPLVLPTKGAGGGNRSA
jgi:diguanylate cyclase (GGDEF)-like protein/PAS domain S-box-containing protein